MQTIRQSYARLREMRFYDKYPNYERYDGKTHILYLCPTLEHTTYYGMILPALELNKTATHNAITTHLNLNEVQQTTDYCLDHIDVRLLEWAHYIIFPTMVSPFKTTAAILRRLYPHLKIGMYLDDNYHKIPVWHSKYQKITATHQQLLIENLSLLDIAICQNHQLAEYYQAALRFYYPEVSCQIHSTAALISTISFENLGVLPFATNRPLTIGIFSPSKTFLNYLPSLINIVAQSGIQPTFIIYGDINSELSLMHYNTISYPDSSTFFNYFRALQQSELTMALFPTSAYIEYQSIATYLDIACLGIPTILCAHHPAAALVKTEEHGLIVHGIQDWHLAISRLTNKALQKKVKLQAVKKVWKQHRFTKKNIEHLAAVFK